VNTAEDACRACGHATPSVNRRFQPYLANVINEGHQCDGHAANELAHDMNRDHNCAHRSTRNSSLNISMRLTASTADHQSWRDTSNCLVWNDAQYYLCQLRYFLLRCFMHPEHVLSIDSRRNNQYAMLHLIDILKKGARRDGHWGLSGVSKCNRQAVHACYLFHLFKLEIRFGDCIGSGLCLSLRASVD